VNEKQVVELQNIELTRKKEALYVYNDGIHLTHLTFRARISSKSN